MQGLVKSNKFISRDEGLHTDYACALYSFIVNRVSKEDVHAMFDEAVKISQEFSKDAIKIEMIGMNADLMDQYVKYVADRLLVMLDYEKLYSVTNPFPFMDTISLTTKDNFFETRPDAYQSAYNEKNTANWEFKIKSEF
jgi:ribonucleotide reductase beta subunit family protein with ferritin-like domain